jgi:hypothetical protein
MRKANIGAFSREVSSALQRPGATVNSQTLLASQIGLGADFVSRVVGGERWPNLNTVPDWAAALGLNPAKLVLAWLRDRAPRVHDSLTEQALSRWFNANPVPLPATAELAHDLSVLPADPRDAIETLIRYIRELTSSRKT